MINGLELKTKLKSCLPSGHHQVKPVVSADKSFNYKRFYLESDVTLYHAARILESLPFGL